MEQEINELREDSDIINKKNLRLDILNLILHRKNEEIEKELK